MNSLSLEDLADRIPRPFELWDNRDLQDWFQLNDIDISFAQLENQGLTGEQAIELGPEDWVRDYDCTMFIARRIVEWIEEESPEFAEVVARRKITRQGFASGDVTSMLRNDSSQTSMLQAYQNKKSFATPQNQPIAELQKQFESQNVARIGNEYVKFVRSNLEQGSFFEATCLFEKVLRIKIPDSQEVLVASDHKIGRSKNNHICLPEESVSRYHAEIIVNKEAHTANARRFFLMDTGSKFGTYVPIRGKSELASGQFYNLSENQIEVVSVTIYSKSVGTKVSRLFDLKIVFNREEEFLFSGKTSITFGKKGDLKLFNCDTLTLYKISLDREKRSVTIEGCDNATVFKRLSHRENWDIEDNIKPDESETSVIFGSLKVQIQVLRRCANCLKVEGCEC